MNDWRAWFAFVEARFGDADVEDAQDELRSRLQGWSVTTESMEVAWTQRTDFIGPMPLGPRLSRGDDDVCHVAYDEPIGDGTTYLVVRRTSEPSPRRAPMPPRVDAAFETVIDRGTRPGGFATLSYYVHGADLRALHGDGVTLSWPLACLLHAAATTPLRELHAAGHVHGAVTAARIRMTLLREYDAELDEIPPIRFVATRFDPATPEAIRDDLRRVAEAVFAMTDLPDPELAALLFTEGGRDVARDVLLERGERVEALLADLVGGDLPIVRAYQDVDPEELANLWAVVSTLDPMISADA